MHTAERLFDSLMMDVPPTAGAMVDFGMDKENGEELYSLYQTKVKAGEITLPQLIKAAGNGPQLSKLLGVEIKTSHDNLFNPFEDTEEDENADF